MPSQGPLGIDAHKPDLAEERPGSMLVNNPIVGQTSVVSPSTNDDMVALREHLIKVCSEPWNISPDICR